MKRLERTCKTPDMPPATEGYITYPRNKSALTTMLRAVLTGFLVALGFGVLLNSIAPLFK